MSRLLTLIGLAAFASLGVTACHSNGPGGDPGDMGEPPMMYQVPSPSHAPAALQACNSASSTAACPSSETR